MGNWNMTVVGVGSHHNTANPKDADRLFDKFVRELKAAGHSIGHASFTHGGAEIDRFKEPEPKRDEL